MESDFRELPGLSVQVNEVLYVPSLEAPAEKPHPFVYFLAIVNDSQEHVVIFGRKWVVEEEGGEVTVLEGDGVVGQRPDLPAGDRYSYNSYHVMAGNGRAWGAFYGLTQEGKKVRVDIPRFEMEIPGWV